jgi:predicted dehydrogenase
MPTIGLIGAGNMGTVHAAALAKLPDVRLAGVVGRGPERAARLAARHATRACDSIEDLLEDPGVDAVVVTVPTALHERVVVEALSRGKHVFCETPLAPDEAAAARMVEAAERSGRLLQVGLLSRLAEPGLRIRHAVREGELGRLEHADFQRIGPPPDRALFGDAVDHYGDVLEELLLFDLDLANWIWGRPRTVRASLARDDALETASVSLAYGELRVAVSGGFAMPPGSPFTISASLSGDRAQMSAVLVLFPDEPPSLSCLLTPEGGLPRRIELRGEDPYAAECRRFVECLAGEADPELLSAGAARASIALLDAARESIRRGERVDL